MSVTTSVGQHEVRYESDTGFIFLALNGSMDSDDPSRALFDSLLEPSSLAEPAFRNARVVSTDDARENTSVSSE